MEEKRTSCGQTLSTHNAKIPYLYITGMEHSGSTLLAFLLNAHPEMVSISEIGPGSFVRIEDYPCSCGTILLQCPFFTELERRVKALGASFSLTKWQTRFQIAKFTLLNRFLVRPLHVPFLERIRDRIVPFWPKYRQKIDLIAERNVHIASSVLALSGKKVFVDGQKDSMRVKFLSEIEQLDLKVIHLIRDVRRNAASYMRRRKKSAALATWQWRIQNMNSDRARRYVSPDRWLRITYEELCSDTQRTIDRISDFVGVSRAPVPKDFYQTEHHIIGNAMRLKGTGVVNLDESWKNQVNKRDLQIIALLGGRTNRYFGYDWP